jgi:hypothetical protein
VDKIRLSIEGPMSRAQCAISTSRLEEWVMTLLTAEQCRETAFRRMTEAKAERSPRRLEFEKTAQAWLTLAEQVERAEALGTFARSELAAQPSERTR